MKGWIGPERVSSRNNITFHSAFLQDPLAPIFACGIRSDNLFAAYAVDKLPKTENEWNKMIFIKNYYGGYKWPRS